jgi:hypothetical protein
MVPETLDRARSDVGTSTLDTVRRFIDLIATIIRWDCGFVFNGFRSPHGVFAQLVPQRS